MAITISTTFVNQFSANVYFLSQQKGSRLKPFVRSESQHAEISFYDRIGTVNASQKTGQNIDVVYSDVPFSRRGVTMYDYFVAELSDQEDKLRLIHSPESEFTQTFMMALGRTIDDIIIAAGLGNAQSGKDGKTIIAFPNSQRIAATETPVPATAVGSKMTIQTLLAVKEKFDAAEAGDDERYIVMRARQFTDLLSTTQVTSSDYNTVKALVQGDLNTFVGFKFIRSERMPLTSAPTLYMKDSGAIVTTGQTGTIPTGAYRSMAWQKLGIILSVGKDMTGKIDPIPHKHYANQVYVGMSLGGVRMEEEKVVEIISV
jgi:hypothetical protein